MWYSNKNHMVNGEVTVGKAEKLNVTFTQQQLLNAKYTIPDGSGCVCVCMCTSAYTQ
jgi:hypothetical protein